MPGLGQQAHDFDRNSALDQPSHTMCPSEVMEARGYIFDKRNVRDVWEGTAVWDWCYFKDKKKIGWYVAWGLTGDGKRFFEDPDVAESDSLLAFVYAGSDPKRVDIPLHRLRSRDRIALAKSGWVISDDRKDCRKARSALTLFAGGEGFTQRFIHWLKEPLTEADEILVKSYAKFKPVTRQK